MHSFLKIAFNVTVCINENVKNAPFLLFYFSTLENVLKNS